jgi:hypothetical protein
MGKSRKMARKSHKRHSKKQTRRMRNKKRNGGGYTDMPKNYINAGNVVHQQYSGPGMDCAGSATRPGYLTSNSFAGTGGLPGLNGKLFGGATQLGSGGPVAAPLTEAFKGNVGTQGFRGYTTGAASELAQMAPAQVGGRYGTDVGAGPLNPLNGVGTTPGPFGRVHCEAGTTDKLNLNPGGIQTMTTAPGYVPGWSHYLKGGKRKTKKVKGGAQLSPAPLTVSVGDVDSMRYYAPTAGYSNFPLAPPVMNNPGILMQTPYNAREFNMACLKTGGGRNNKKNGGEDVAVPPVEAAEEASVNAAAAAANATQAAVNANAAAANASQAAINAKLVNAAGVNGAAATVGGVYPVAAMAGQFTPVTMADYKSGMLPVKFGGRKNNKRRNKTRRGGAFKAFDDTQLPMTPGMPVAAQAGNFPNFQRIPVGHYIPGSSVNTGPVSRPAAGGARKNRKNKKSNK